MQTHIYNNNNVHVYPNHTHTHNSNNNSYDVTDQQVNHTTIIDNDDLLWLQWKHLHQKNYSTYKEYNEHRKNWLYNLHSIKQHNLMHDKGLELYTIGLNQFSDLNWSHISTIYLTNLSQYFLNRHKKQSQILLKQSLNETRLKEIPDSWDWRKVGVVSKVKVQTKTTNVAAAASTSIGLNIRKRKSKILKYNKQNAKPITLDDETLEDVETFTYLGSIIDEQGKCQHIKSTSLTYSKSIIEIKLNDEEQLKYVLYEHGPVSAGINVEQQFMRYKSGIYQSQSCSSTEVNHAVLIVGYGEENGVQYWTIKNSWGTSWGEEGYVRMRRNYNNMCGIATMASVPKL
ncbi:SmCL2-like peptidase (C01 family) [Schistosoma mansoni]|uniref:SmCL2-like peptidase (C01 family) n=1 Tax=Schistosoma mansoni TaxID=6183 RepID=UPI0001A643AA|nr:SmCL2-like peptidase (C01 family) [Schistosoma mansoni]|eukprot:XP_018646152.1 SmCL2-like peptidase (C01 family) [Schistosoma mansoni]